MVAAVCLRDHWDEMQQDDRDWCIAKLIAELDEGGESTTAALGAPRQNAASQYAAFVLPAVLREAGSRSDPGVVEATLGEAVGDPALDPTVCFAHHCDWHLPAIGELRTILIGLHAAPGQAMTCGSAPCIDPDFAAVGGPTESSLYWSASTFADFPLSAWFADFNFGQLSIFSKTLDHYVRAVRAGSCN